MPTIPNQDKSKPRPESVLGRNRGQPPASGPKMVQQTIEPVDVCVYLRCHPAHYYFNSVEYYTNILPRILANSATNTTTGELNDTMIDAKVWWFKYGACFVVPYD